MQKRENLGVSEVRIGRDEEAHNKNETMGKPGIAPGSSGLWAQRCLSFPSRCHGRAGTLQL